MNLFAVNQLVTFNEDNHIERVLWVEPARPGYFLIDIALERALPLYRSHTELENLADSGQIQLDATDPFPPPIDEDAIVPRHRAHRDKNWARIAPLLTQQPAIFDPNRRGKIVSALMKEVGENHVALYRLLRRYWQRGMTRNALLPDYAKCGGRGKDKKISDKPLGRRPKNPELASANAGPETRKLFRNAITCFYASNSVFDLTECYHKMLRDFYTDSIINPQNGRQELVVRAGAPSLRQFRYWYKKDNNIFTVTRNRSPRQYDKDKRGLLGTSTSDAFGPGARYQVDATIADVYLVSRYSRDRIVGRPVVYVLIDVFSHMITGIHAGFEGPSWVGAMEALGNAFLGKVDYCRRFGIDIRPEEWPSVGMPERLLGDRAELAGRMVETLINNFHLHVENTAPYRADWKGLVEQQFRLLPAHFKAYTPGYIQDDYQLRGGTDYRLDAKLDIDQFTRILIFTVLAYNNSHVLTGYPLAPEMINDGISPIPTDMWNWGVVRRSGLLRTYPAEWVRLSLLPSDEATVTTHGIRFFDCSYSCPLAIQEHWFDKARQSGSWKVKISYDPRMMDDIWLHMQPGQHGFTACSMTDRSRDHRGKSLWEIDQLRQEARNLKSAGRPRQTQGRVALINRVESIVREAEAMAPDTTGISNRSRTASIRANRKEERLDLQRRDALRAERTNQPEKAQVVPFPNTPPVEDYSQPDITEILRRFREEEDEP